MVDGGEARAGVPLPVPLPLDWQSLPSSLRVYAELAAVIEKTGDVVAIWRMGKHVNVGVGLHAALNGLEAVWADAERKSKGE